MRQATLNVFKFEELSDEVKTKIINDWHESENNDTLENEFDFHVSELPKYLSHVRLSYSLRYSQGDGLSFTADFDINKFIEIKGLTYKQSIVDIIDNEYGIVFNGNKGRYSYAMDNQVEFKQDLSYSHGTRTKRVYKIACELLSIIQEDYTGICFELEKKGYAHLEYRMSFNEFAEFAEANGYEYYENGELV